MTTISLVDESAGSQMGVSMLLKGTDYWFTYLDAQVAAASIDQAQRDDWEEKYDGYEMAWTFVNPRVTTGNGHIDAACIYGKNVAGTIKYSGGGFCCGIKYVGSFSSQPEIYAVWFSD